MSRWLWIRLPHTQQQQKCVSRRRPSSLRRPSSGTCRRRGRGGRRRAFCLSLSLFSRARASGNEGRRAPPSDSPCEQVVLLLRPSALLLGHRVRAAPRAGHRCFGGEANGGKGADPLSLSLSPLSLLLLSRHATDRENSRPRGPGEGDARGRSAPVVDRRPLRRDRGDRSGRAMGGGRTGSSARHPLFWGGGGRHGEILVGERRRAGALSFNARRRRGGRGLEVTGNAPRRERR